MATVKVRDAFVEGTDEFENPDERESDAGKVVCHVIGPTATHRLSISKLIGSVVQVYESTQRTRCRCTDFLATPIGSGHIHDAKKRLHARTMQTWTFT